MPERFTRKNHIISRLLSLDDEYEALKASLDDGKQTLAALKQQADLLALILKASGDINDEPHHTIDNNPEKALEELRVLFKKLSPFLSA